MKSENGGCSNVCEGSKVEFTEDQMKPGGCNGIACENGGKAGENANRDIAVDRKVDPEGGARAADFVEEIGVRVPKEDKLAGEEHEPCGQMVDKRILILENGHDHEAGVVLNSESEGKESAPSGVIELKENGIPCDEKREIENSCGEKGENGGLCVEKFDDHSGPESAVESVVKVEEKQEHESITTETGQSESVPFENEEAVKDSNVANEIPVGDSLGYLESEPELKSETELEKEVYIGSQESGCEKMLLHAHCVDSKAELSDGPLESSESMPTSHVDSVYPESVVVDSEAEVEHVSIEVRKVKPFYFGTYRVEPFYHINGSEFESEAKHASFKSQESVSACVRLDNNTVGSEESMCPSNDAEIEAKDSCHSTNANRDMATDHGSDANTEIVVDSNEDSLSTNTDSTDKLACEEDDSGEDISCVVETNEDVSAGESIIHSVEEDVQSVAIDDGVCKEDIIEEADRGAASPSSSEDPISLASHELKEDPSSLASVDPSSLALHGQKVDTDVKRVPCFMVRIPRLSDDNLKGEIQHAQLQVDKKTQSRDSIRLMLQKQKGVCSEYWEKCEAARKEERAARDAVAAKRQEMDLTQSIINKIRNATSIDDIDSRVQKLDNRIQHETIPLTEKKKLMREITQLKRNREQLSSNLASQEELENAFEQRAQIEKRLEIFKEELDSLKNLVVQAELNTKASGKKYDDEKQHSRNLQVQFKAADDLRQEAYAHLRGLKKKSFEKNEYFYTYKDDAKAAADYALSGDREALQSHCSNQVEKIMELWNKNDDFRKDYVKANIMSTVRRFRTLDGRSLGLDEEPTVLHNIVDEKVKNGPLPSSRTDIAQPAPELKQEKADQPMEPEKSDLEAPVKVTQKNHSAKSTKLMKANETTMALTITGIEEAKEQTEREKKRTAEEEVARKAEELAKKEEELKKEAELKEQHRLEQIAKAKVAAERKRRKAEKDQARAVIKAQREAELREKKRADKAKKKAKKAAASDTAIGGSEVETVVSGSSNPPQSTKETELKATAASKKPSRPSPRAKNYNNKVKPLPLALRNRGRRKMQTWMWVVLAVLIVLGLFLLGNYINFPSLSLPSFGSKQ